METSTFLPISSSFSRSILDTLVFCDLISASLSFNSLNSAMASFLWLCASFNSFCCAAIFSFASWRTWNHQAVKKFSLLPSLIRSHSEIIDASGLTIYRQGVGFRVKSLTHYTNSPHCHQYIFADIFERRSALITVIISGFAWPFSPLLSKLYNVMLVLITTKSFFHRICLKLCYPQPMKHFKINWWRRCYSKTSFVNLEVHWRYC